jgi:DNA-binding response OmpR family regulator
LPDANSTTRRLNLHEDVVEPDLGLEILLVAGEGGLADTMKGFVQKNRLTTAASGKKAILEFARRKFDVVFLDGALAGEFNGIETLERLKTIHPKSRVVFLADEKGASDQEPRVKKADFVLEKPITGREVYRCLTR